jgi:PAS domain S-box-containing protein
LSLRGKEDFSETEKSKRFIEFAPVGLYEIKFDPPHFVWVNEETCRILGYTSEELLKMNPLDFLDEDGKRLFLERIKRNLAGERVEPQAEFKIKTKDGKELWASINATFTRKNGVVDGALVAAQDITERRQAEQEIMRAKQLLEAHLNNAPEAVIEFDPEYRVIRWSKEAERIFGWSAEEILGRSIEEMPWVYKDDVTLVGKVAADMLSGKRPKNLNVNRNYRKDGSMICCEWYNSAIYNVDGKLTSVLSLVLDVTERKKAEEALRASEERHRVISDITTDFVFSCVKTPHNEFAIDWMAGATEKVFGYSASEIRAKRCWRFTVQTQDLSIFEEKVTGLRPGQSSVSELRITHKNGSTRWLEVVAQMEQDDSNPRNCTLFGACRDITERKKAEEKLKESEERFFKAFQLNPAPMAISFVGGKFTDVNHSFERLTGFTRDEVIGKRGVNLGMYGSASERKELKRRLQQDGHVYNFPMTFNTKSMKQVHVLFSLEQIKLQNKPLVLGTAIDVTEKKRLQDELEKYSRSLEELVKQKTEQLRDKERLAAIGTTAGMVGHDIRNPLQAIVGDLYLAKSDLAAMPESEEKGGLQESLAEIEKNVEYIDKIVQDLQDFAKTLNPVVRETDLEEVCNEVLFKNNIEENVEVSYEVRKEARELISDPEYLKRILSNLVSNAVQAMPEGGKLMIQGFKDADGVVITVEDTGVGIPDEVKPRLFTPLFTTKSRGQGFGLAVVKRMTEALGGTVTFESEEGKGTKFIIHLPQSRK